MFKHISWSKIKQSLSVMFEHISWSTIKQSLPLFPLIYLPPIIILIILWSIAEFTDTPLKRFFTDPPQLVNYDSYYGLINYLGVVLWASAMAICIFTYIALRKIGKRGDIAKFALFSGLLTLILLLDDLFLIHEWLQLYTIEPLVYFVYIIIFILLIFRFRAYILKTDYIFLILAMGFFGISLAFDFAQSLKIVAFSGERQVLIEEGSKFLGIISWLTYYARVCLASLRREDIT